MRVRFPIRAEKGVSYENGKPYMDFLVSGTKLDRTSYTDDQGRQVIGEKIAPVLLDKMLEQANGAHIPQQQAAGGIYFIESHEATIPMGWVVGATREDLESGDWQLHAKVQLDPKHPLVPVLIENVESGKYVPDCSVGLKVLKGTAWDEEENGYVGYLFDGFWEHLAMTKPGHPAYPDAELEGVFLAKNLLAAAGAVYQSVAKDVDQANKAESANEAVMKGESSMDPVKVAGAGLVAKNKEAESESESAKSKDSEAKKESESEAKKEAGAEAEADAGKTKEAEAEANNEAAADASAEAARKRKEAEMAAEAEAEAEAKRKGLKTPPSVGEPVADAGLKDAGALPPKAGIAPAAAGAAPPPKAGSNLASYMRNIHQTMKEGVEGESSPEDFKALMADIMDDFEEACEMADAMGAASTHEAEKGKEAGALTITHEDAPAAKNKEEEMEASKAKEAEAEACKTAEAEADAKKEELVTKSVADRRTRRLMREMNKTIGTLVASNKEMVEKLANLDKKPASNPGPLRYADTSAAHLRARASAGPGDSNLVEVIKSIEDPQKRDLVSRAVGQDILQTAIATQFPALAEAQAEWDKTHGKA